MKDLYKKIIERLSCLCIAEKIKMSTNCREKAKDMLFREPFKYHNKLLEEKLEQQIQDQLRNNQRAKPFRLPGYKPHQTKP